MLIFVHLFSFYFCCTQSYLFLLIQFLLWFYCILSLLCLQLFFSTFTLCLSLTRCFIFYSSFFSVYELIYVSFLLLVSITYFTVHFLQEPFYFSFTFFRVHTFITFPICVEPSCKVEKFSSPNYLLHVYPPYLSLFLCPLSVLPWVHILCWWVNTVEQNRSEHSPIGYRPSN